jgi:hypothetical protein
MHNGIFDSCKSPLYQSLRLIHTPLFARETLQTAHAPSLGISATGGSAAGRHRNSCFMITTAYRTYIMCRMDTPYAYIVFYISNSLYGRIPMCSSFKTYYHGGTCAGILEQSMGARIRIEKCRRTGPPGLQRLAIDSLEWISVLLKSLKIPPLETIHCRLCINGYETGY